MSKNSDIPVKNDLASIIEHIPAVVFRLSHREDNWKTWFVTKNVSMYGYTPEEFTDGDKNWFDIVHPDDRVLVSKNVNDYEAKRINEYRLFYRIVTKNGDSVPVTEYNTVNRDKDGNVICYDTVIINSTQHESAGKRLIDDHYRQQLVLNDLLMSLHDSDLDHALQIILDRTGQYLDTSRALLFKDSPDHTTCKVVYEWCNKGIPSVMDLDYSITYSTEMPEIYIALQDTGILLVNFGEIPENCREEFENEGLIASAIFAVYLNGEHYGFVCFDDCVVERTWDDDTARFLKNVSNLISTVLVRQETAKRLEISQKTCETVLDNVDSYIFVTEPNTNRIIFANRAFKNTFEEQCEGKNASTLLSIDLDAIKFVPAAQPSETALPASYPEVFCKKTDEWLAVSADLMTWVDGQTVRLINCYDVTAKKRYETTIEKLAFLDHLTGLPNRYRCDVDLEVCYQNAVEAGKDGALLFIDMDDFKLVNDCYGHDYGDAVLITFANYLKGVFREPNKVFRFGGDEFVVLISHEDAGNTQQYLDMLKERAASPWQALDKEFFCTLSIGVLLFPAGGETTKTIIKHADIAMYEAKRRGKNMFEYYETALDENTMLRSRMEALLRKSMSNGFEGFEVYYQPIVDAKTEEIIGAEALLRMYDYDKIILPNEFVPLADYLGFIVPIGEHVLRTAAEQCMKIRSHGRKDFKITVNISEKQLHQRDLAQRIEGILAECGADAGCITAAVSENVAVENIGRMLELCRKFEALGIDVEFDDFGGGRASFLRMQDIPVHTIKTSNVFMESFDQGYSKEFIGLVVKLSHSMDKKVCINGIETEAQYHFCKQCGAEELQGFFLHPAVGFEELEKRLCMR
ncbi:EAL domain-containing protein [Oscillospiraceae bacterium OttesenSCG-928-G22]|nr:EAL domain-containing protein [Oscillospiraceae bacterium OttesenSCG-928-G22]